MRVPGGVVHPQLTAKTQSHSANLAATRRSADGRVGLFPLLSSSPRVASSTGFVDASPSTVPVSYRTQAERNRGGVAYETTARLSKRRQMRLQPSQLFLISHLLKGTYCLVFSSCFFQGNLGNLSLPAIRFSQETSANRRFSLTGAPMFDYVFCFSPPFQGSGYPKATSLVALWRIHPSGPRNATRGAAPWLRWHRPWRSARIRTEASAGLGGEDVVTSWLGREGGEGEGALNYLALERAGREPLFSPDLRRM